MRIIASIWVYTFTTVLSYVLTGAIHIFSGKGLHGIFIPDVKVRWLGHYLFDAIPFFIISFILVSSIIYILLNKNRTYFPIFALTGILSSALAAIFHQPLFPVSPRGLIFLVTFGLIFVSTYSFVDKCFFGSAFFRQKFCPFPYITTVIPGLLCGGLTSIIFIAAFQIAISSGLISDRESYDRSLVVSTSQNTYFKNKNSTDVSKTRARPLAPSAPNVGLLIGEEIVLDGGPMDQGRPSLIDFDGNGFTDLVFPSNGKIKTVFNRGGFLKNKPDLLRDLETDKQKSGLFSFSDFDKDGDFDIIFSKRVIPREPAFVSNFLRYLYWFPSNKPTGEGRIFRNIDGSKWQDISSSSFLDGLPWVHRKSEPIPWFDVNADGLLDFVWSGYPHPRKSMNRLYIQKEGGGFVDGMKQLIRWSPGRVYPEGSDMTDYDNDGDLDFFAYGYLFRNENGVFKQVCGKEMPGMACDAEARNDEGVLFEDVNGDGLMDMVLSYHGAEGELPKFTLQLFLGDPIYPRYFKRVKEFERRFYGANYLLRAVDFDFNGNTDILTTDPGRILTFTNNQWVDLLPAVSKKAFKSLNMLGWLDIEEDGDWDLLARRNSDSRLILYRNNYNPTRYMKISAVGEGGIENQYGTTIKISGANQKVTLHTYRLMAGMGSVSDPRLIYLLEPNLDYNIDACFTSLLKPPTTPKTPSGVTLKISSIKGRCVKYLLKVKPQISRLDLKLVAGVEGALVKTH